VRFFHRENVTGFSNEHFHYPSKIAKMSRNICWLSKRNANLPYLHFILSTVLLLEAGLRLSIRLTICCGVVTEDASVRVCLEHEKSRFIDCTFPEEKWG
jgi:hypothetical protein